MMDEMREYSDLLRSWLWVGLVDQFIYYFKGVSLQFSEALNNINKYYGYFLYILHDLSFFSAIWSAFYQVLSEQLIQ